MTSFSRTAAVGVLSVAMALLLLAPGCGGPSVALVTTVHVVTSGVLNTVISDLGKQQGVSVKVSAEADPATVLVRGRDGEADVVIVPAGESVNDFVKNADGLQRVDFMYNDLVVIGPPGDPAGVKGLTSGVASCQRIGGAKVGFVTMGGASDLDGLISGCWEGAGISTDGQPWYLETGKSVEDTIREAGSKQAYSIVDLGTWEKINGKVPLMVLAQGGNTLRNQYSLVVVNPEKYSVRAEDAHSAGEFVWFLTGQQGQERIAESKVSNSVVFHPDAIEQTRGMGTYTSP
jgi:tungstate transport system substrate-binding protein